MTGASDPRHDLQQVIDRGLQLRVLAHERRVGQVVHDDVRIDAMPLDEPGSLGPKDAKLARAREPVVDQLLGHVDWPRGARSLVDTSCGDGAFLRRALARLLDQFGARLRYVLVKNQIRGDDFSQLEKSGEQARAVIGGLEADVVTLALAEDINALYERALARKRDAGGA